MLFINSCHYTDTFSYDISSKLYIQPVNLFGFFGNVAVNYFFLYMGLFPHLTNLLSCTVHETGVVDNDAGY